MEFRNDSPVDTSDPADQKNGRPAMDQDRQLFQSSELIPDSRLRQYFLALARRVQEWNRCARQPAKIGVTSIQRQASRSIVSFNLAAALTRIETSSILMIESDFGRHPMTRHLSIAGSPGFGEVIIGTADPAQCIADTPIEQFSILPSGRVNEQESLELPFKRLPKLLESEFRRFGYLVFDLPVADDLTSCYSIVPQLDGIILVLESGALDRQQIEKAKQRIAACGTDLIGAVINRNH